jgi:hypothetical protein
MTSNRQTDTDKPQEIIDAKLSPATEAETILCAHCQRTATNGMKCKGICVVDSDY